MDSYIFSYATYGPEINPLTSLLPCDTLDSSQRWYFNVSSSVALPGSLVDGRLGQCFAIDGCSPTPGTSVWMWPCVTTTVHQNCNAANQLWTYNASSGRLVTDMSTGFCATAVPSTGAAGEFTLVMLPCDSVPPGGFGTFFYDATTALMHAGSTSSGQCLSSLPPASSNGDATHVSVGLRLGGMTNTSNVAAAYSGSFFSFGYFFTVSPDGTWKIYAGAFHEDY